MSFEGKYVSVIIVAAGLGRRMQSNTSKQYMTIGEKPILAHSIEVFDRCEAIDEIIVVTKEEEKIFCKEEVINRYGFNKIKGLVSGGKERQNSVYNGLQAVDKKVDIVLIHDGVRPFIEKTSIMEGIKNVVEHGACVIGVPVKDTIKQINKDNEIIDSPNRSSLWAVQTPQCFRYDLIVRAYEEGLKRGDMVTDDSMFVEKLGYKVKMIMGSYDNIKITTPEDIYFAEAILNRRRSAI